MGETVLGRMTQILPKASAGRVSVALLLAPLRGAGFHPLEEEKLREVLPRGAAPAPQLKDYSGAQQIP